MQFPFLSGVCPTLFPLLLLSSSSKIFPALVDMHAYRRGSCGMARSTTHVFNKCLISERLGEGTSGRQNSRSRLTGIRSQNFVPMLHGNVHIHLRDVCQGPDFSGYYQATSGPVRCNEYKLRPLSFSASLSFSIHTPATTLFPLLFF
jgi:hypothetical protein